MNNVIEVSNLIKKYGENTVIDAISFNVNKGEIFGLLGANGAGKTTTLECIEKLRSYNSGTIQVNGKIGVQLQSSSLPENITVLEAFKLFCKWNNANEDLELLNKLGMKDLKNKQYASMSTGQKRRLHLALALIGSPDIIFLDEPTAGVDVEGRVALHDEIRNLKANGKTIIMASHDMAEVEELCDRIAILKTGKIAFIGTPIELTSIYLEEKVYIKTSEKIEIQEFKYSKYIELKEEYYVFKTDTISDSLLELLTYLKENNNKVLDLKIERESLEHRFIQIAKEEV
jgi:ABC-2 type transport system ATP-binding protein